MSLYASLWNTRLRLELTHPSMNYKTQSQGLIQGGGGLNRVTRQPPLILILMIFIIFIREIDIGISNKKTKFFWGEVV